MVNTRGGREPTPPGHAVAPITVAVGYHRAGNSQVHIGPDTIIKESAIGAGNLTITVRACAAPDSQQPRVLCFFCTSIAQKIASLLARYGACCTGKGTQRPLAFLCWASCLGKATYVMTKALDRPAYRWGSPARHGCVCLVACPSSAGIAGVSHGSGMTGSARLQMHGLKSAFDGMMLFRVPSRQSLGWGGQHDSPPVYALIHHYKAPGPQPVRQNWHARARTLRAQKGPHQ